MPLIKIKHLLKVEFTISQKVPEKFKTDKSSTTLAQVIEELSQDQKHHITVIEYLFQKVIHPTAQN